MSARRRIVAIIVCVIGIMPFLTTARGQEPIRLHPQNPHYFLWRGQPTVLITSAEHYGAVLNRAFNGTKYLDTLQTNGFNLTRTFSGAYCEPVGAFNIANNTLAPAAGDLLCPWARSDTPGYASRGVAIELFRKPDIFRKTEKLRFRINPKALKDRGFVVLAQIFDVAEIVE